MELGSFTNTQISTWKSTINASIKAIYKCGRTCSNKLLKCVSISNLTEYLDFKRSILENLMFSNPYTQLILFHRMENATNNLCSSYRAMLGRKRKTPPYNPSDGMGDDTIDSLQALIKDWGNYSSHKQFRDILHEKLPQ